MSTSAIDDRRSCSPARKLDQADSQHVLDPQLNYLPLFQELDSLYPPYSPNHDSSSVTDTSSPPDSHCEDNAATAAAAPDDFLSYLSYNSEIVTSSAPSSMQSNHLEIRILGVPSTGAKSRVETQIKLCIQLMTANDRKVQDWAFIRLGENMLARSRLRKNQQQQQQQQQRSLDGSVATMVSDESKVLRLEAQVVCSSNTAQPIRMCAGCVRREKKRAERTKDGKQKSELAHEDAEAERDRILLFNCSPMVNFSSGDAILPTRITCYCRHHNEKVGFRICFTMKDSHGRTIAEGISPPIMITDDHKSSKQKTSRKRSRPEDDPTAAISRPDTPAPSRKNSASLDSLEMLDDVPTGSTTPTSLNFSNSSISVLTNSNSSSSSNIYSDFFPPPPLALSATAPATEPQDEKDAMPVPAATEEVWPFNRRRRTASGYASADDPIMASLWESFNSVAVVPQVERLVPAQGPTYGGVEVTLLGSGFYQGLTCLFGEHAATTAYWNPNTIVCILPPATHTGPVVVSFKEYPLVLEGQDVAIFTYYDASDQALLELALQVVGLKMTGKLHDAKQVAMRIVQGGEPSQQQQQQQQQQLSHQQLVLDALEHADQPDLTLANASGHTLLHLAVILDNESLVKAIVQCYTHCCANDRQTLLNARDRNEMTALHFACRMKSMRIVGILLHAGANASSVDVSWLKSCGGDNSGCLEIIDLLDLHTTTYIKRRPLSRRNSGVKSHMMHRFHSLSSTEGYCADKRTQPSMESDGLGLVRQKIDRRLYLFWLPLLTLAIGLLFVQIFGQPALLRPILDLLPKPNRIPLSA
ncbi:hypothetical protein [Parasitella parasitica]|uniref:IPT/TIG domain-containing protein n=1 Tax=Parasitella parasitica TaxID=35722 RepID=A0A0B7NH47_9FUNG|nr:hypothetical protein [Parasitella parasitica]